MYDNKHVFQAEASDPIYRSEASDIRFRFPDGEEYEVDAPKYVLEYYKENATTDTEYVTREFMTTETIDDEGKKTVTLTITDKPAK